MLSLKKVILLHCIIQPESSGGESEMTDGLTVCERLNKTNVDYYKTLTSLPVRWIDRGHDSGHSFHNVYHAPVIWQVPIHKNIFILSYHIGRYIICRVFHSETLGTYRELLSINIVFCSSSNISKTEVCGFLPKK